MRRAGWNRDTLKLATIDGRLFHVRRGYYAEPGAHPALVKAVRVGGRATGTTALARHGVWVPPDDTSLHVLVPRNGGRLRDPDHKLERLPASSGVCVHWAAGAVKPGLTTFTPLVDVLTALVHAVEDLPDDFAVAAIDSALHQRLLPTVALEALRVALPLGRRRLIGFADGQSQAGGESIVRYRLQVAGYRVRIQVGVRGVGSIDVLVEDRLVVEVDGIRFHLGDQFAEDRRRDLELTTVRVPHLRLTYAQVLGRWERCLAAVDAALTSGH